MGFLLAVATIIGIALGQHAVPVSIIGCLVLAAASAVVAFLNAQIRALAIALAIAILAATWSGSILADRLAAAERYPPGSWVIARGFVDEPPIERDGETVLSVRAYAARHDLTWQEEGLRLAVRAAPGLSIGVGEHVEVAGPVREPQSDGERAWIDRQHRAGFVAVLDRARVSRLGTDSLNPPLAALDVIRQQLTGGLRRSLPEPEASLAAGILLGDRTGIPADLRRAFDEVGVSHLIAISGTNIAIVIGALVLVLRAALGRRLALVLALVVVPVYVVLVGSSPSVVRAAAMGLIVIVGVLAGREAHAWTLLAVASAVVLIAEPSLLHDAGFQLSVAATAGVFAAVPAVSAITQWPGRSPQGGVLNSAIDVAGLLLVGGLACLIVTLATTVTTAPIIAASFARLSVIAPLANLLIGWTLPPIMASSLLVAIAGAIAPELGTISAYLAWPFLSYFVDASVLLAGIDAASIATGPVPGWFVGVYYVALVLPALAVDRQRNFGPFSTAFRSLLGWLVGLPLRYTLPPVLLAGVAVWAAAVTAPFPAPSARYLDVPGEALLIQAGGRTVLIDGGASPSSLLLALGEELPFAKRAIDLLVVSGPSSSRTGGLRGLTEHYRVEAVLAVAADEHLVRDLFDSGRDPLPYPVPAYPGQRIALADGIQIDVLEVGRPEDATGIGALLLRLHTTEQQLLLAGASSDVMLRRALDAGLDLTAHAARVPQDDASGVRAWPGIRPAVAPQIEIVRADRPSPAGEVARHRLGLDGGFVLMLGNASDLRATSETAPIVGIR